MQDVQEERKRRDTAKLKKRHDNIRPGVTERRFGDGEP